MARRAPAQFATSQSFDGASAHARAVARFGGSAASGVAGCTVVVVLLLIAGAGCASWSSTFARQSDGTLVHKERGYRIGAPGPVNAIAWEEVSVEGATLSFRHSAAGAGPESAGVASLTLMTDCSELVPTPSLEARNLRLGLGATRLVFSAPTEHLGASGWAQAFESDFEGKTAYVEAVTLIVDRCTYDLILVAPIGAAGLDRVFAAWWITFVPPPGVPAATTVVDRGSGSDAR